MNEATEGKRRTELETDKSTPDAEILSFAGIGGRDVYNPAIVVSEGKKYLAGRVEKHDDQQHPEVCFFTEEEKGAYRIDDVLPRFKLEDPFVSYINGEIIFGGTETTWKGGEASFRVVFYRGETLESLRRFAAGPPQQKDIRLIGLPNHRIGTYVRPQNESSVRPGRIGYIELDSIDELNELTSERIMKDADLFLDQFGEHEWGGANQIHLLPDGRHGVLAHIVEKDSDDVLHYKVITFIYDPETGERTEYRVIAERRDFPETDAKPDRKGKNTLKDVVYPGHLECDSDFSRGTLYVGLSDAAVGRKVIEDPFGLK